MSGGMNRLLAIATLVVVAEAPAIANGQQDIGKLQAAEQLETIVRLDSPDVVEISQHIELALPSTMSMWGPAAVLGNNTYVACDRSDCEGFLIQAGNAESLFRFGQGPGEFTIVDNIATLGADLFVVGFSGGGLRAVRYDSNGSLLTQDLVETVASGIVPTDMGYIGVEVSSRYDGDSLVVLDETGSRIGSFMPERLLSELGSALNADTATDLLLSRAADKVVVAHPLLNKLYWFSQSGTLLGVATLIKDPNRPATVDPRRPLVHYTDISANTNGYVAVAHSSVRSVSDSDDNEVGRVGRVDILGPRLEHVCTVLVPGRPLVVALGKDELLVCTNRNGDRVLVFDLPL